jgi:predicted amidohydrolase YtcJ
MPLVVVTATRIPTPTGGSAQGKRDAGDDSIEMGKRADLVVLGTNLFEVEPSAIHDVPVHLTMMDGRITDDAR